MKHSIYTVLNSSYMPFGKIFIQSYLKYNSDNNEYIYILDSGLSGEDFKWFKQYGDKIRFIKSHIATEFKNGQDSADWTATVVSKTIGLRALIEQIKDVTPIVMIDADCLFLQEISSLIDMDKDIQICNRPAHDTPMLGSYVSINKVCMEFLEKWIETIPTINTPWKESPALSKIYHEFKDKLEIGLIPEEIVSCYKPNKITSDVKIVHFKSSATHATIEESIQKRIYERGFEKEVEEYV